ncbi:unnamed protein product [Rotaria magnacalcarata]|uniref:E3 ubiquitin-protein ligase n=1 Tax=Rotaria magnacalcarata TaxID=392030 RepID=A0A815FGQ7_9BILA|nr:unnamed protein product [Rotaria magnacalcarata]
MNSLCEWCDSQPAGSQVTNNCQHKLCCKCIIDDKTCQSNCPMCWYTNGSKFIRNNKICGVCCSGINLGDKIVHCKEGKHGHCSECYENGCILCQFRKTKLWNDVPYRHLGANSQQVLYTCHIWQTKYEDFKQSTMNSKMTSDRDDPSPMDVDDKEYCISGQYLSQKHTKKSSTNEEVGDCMICLENLGSSYHKLEVCGHLFHKLCINQWFQSTGKQSCPNCGYVYGISKGPQPSNGQMTCKFLPMPLPGFENEKYGFHEAPTIEITYRFPPGTQGPLNPNPGSHFSGTTRTAYLPNNKEGKDILKLLKKAFDDQHIFTIGRSSTSGQDNVITWNDIHHKTSIHGGPDRFGYPDPTYLFRVRQELSDKGYK